MAQSNQTRYKFLPEWTIHQTDKSLIISGGADARYEIELESSEPSFFSSLKHSEPFTRKELSARDQRVLEELITAEIIVPVLQKSKVLKVAMIGDKSELAPARNKEIAIIKSSPDYGLALIIRTNSTYAGLLEKIKYQTITKPHLFVDMAFHHTLSLGPLVFPGETACVACLQGRVSTRWGDETPPVTPRTVNKYGKIVSELIATELLRIANGDTSLTNKTVSWNFQDRAVKKDQLLKVPLCPICTKNKIDQGGALALPW